ncbi:hypothetical protein [Puia sp.]|jgi:ATP-binding cassette subfamily B protein|uniref:hypothetical protein n=1 Tax=Puia sp. TaxID=2045100 RepID=UPI002F413EC6
MENDTIYNIIRSGRPGATDMEIHIAAEKARVLDFALELPEGLQARTGNGGSRLSRSQWHCIGLARTLLRDKAVTAIAQALTTIRLPLR